VGQQCGYADARDQLNDVFDIDLGDMTRGLNFLTNNESNRNTNDDYSEEDLDGGDDIIADDDRFEAHFRMQDAELDDLFVTENRAGTSDEDMAFADNVFDGDINLDHCNGLATTDPGTLPIYNHIEEGSDYATSSASNHVLLNNLGHMLIRRDKQLDGTSNQRHFLQRLVSRTPGDTLPLTY
jgi:hypothetical protein